MRYNALDTGDHIRGRQSLRRTGRLWMARMLRLKPT